MKAVVTVVGEDRTGIIYNVSKVLAEKKVNIEDLSQTLMQGYFTMMMLVDLKNMTCDFDELQEELNVVGNEIGMSIRVQHEDIFNTMHNI
jgi:ACT domain-containing protein